MAGSRRAAAPAWPPVPRPAAARAPSAGLPGNSAT